MITWMQRHRRWLVITIWISTVAFIGAGFVGWGTYNYSKSSKYVATVGSKKISRTEYQTEYNSIYDRYSKGLGSGFTKEVADKMHLRQIALQSLIQRNLLLNFADDLGLGVSDKEVAQKLIGMKVFYKNGNFDKKTYEKVLAVNGLKISDFEASLRQDVLLQKIEDIFAINPSLAEVKNFGSILFSQDNLSLQILKLKDMKVKINEKELKAYWLKNKAKYKSNITYKIDVYKTHIAAKTYALSALKNYYKTNKDSLLATDGKILSFELAKGKINKILSQKDAKFQALKDYIKLKKSKLSFDKREDISLENIDFPKSVKKKIKFSSLGKFIKPFVHKDYYLTLQIVNKNPRKILGFKKAKSLVLVDFQALKKQDVLKLRANKALKDFKGKSIGFVSRTSLDKIAGLDAQESAQFLQKLFMLNKKNGIIYLNNKALIYNISGSKLAKFDKNKEAGIRNTIKLWQSNELMSKIIGNLQNKYEIKIYLNDEKGNN